MARARFNNKNQFFVGLDRFKDATEQDHANLIRKVAFQLLDLIVRKTPVDTGRARGNWQVAVDTEAGEATVDGGPAGAVTAIGLSKLASVKAFSTVVIYNNVEYIVFLEEGSSTQAPQGMVQISIAEVESQFR